MAENYIEGDLGETFERATPLPLPVVGRLVEQVINSLHRTDKVGNLDVHVATLRRCQEKLSVLEETCATEEVGETLHAARIRLRRVEDFTNSHLAMLAHRQRMEDNAGGDEEGFVLDLGGGEMGGDGSHSSVQYEGLRAFEVVGLTTLMPKSAEEAIVLVPSLSRFDLEDLYEKAVRLLES